MNGHQCDCDCAQARARSAYQLRLWRWFATYVWLVFFGSIVFYACVLPASWDGVWVWIPALLTWMVVAGGPVWACRWWVRRRALSSRVPYGRRSPTTLSPSLPLRAERRGP